MIRLLIIIGLLLLSSLIGYAQPISLIDENINHQNQQAITNESQEFDDMNDVEDTPSLNEDEYQEMNDFIIKEDKKMKEIKLLSLDLQKADIELKKKELEQKISKLSNGHSVLDLNVEEVGEGVKQNTSAMKLVSVFITDSQRTALINKQGQNRQVMEGDVIDAMKVKNILNSKVIFELADHQVGELGF